MSFRTLNMKLSSKLAGGGLAAATLFAAVAAWSAPAAAVAAAVRCGDTLTGPVALTHDLHCDGDGVVLLSGELDLDGHTISGAGAGIGVSVGHQSPAAGSSEVSARIVDGDIEGFGTAIASPGYDTLSLTMDNVLLARNFTGLNAELITSTSMRHVRVKHNAGPGIIVFAPNVVAMRDSRVIDNAQGLALISDGRADLSNTLVEDNGAGVFCSQGLLTMDGVAVSGNDVGVELFQCEGTTMTNVRFVKNSQAGINALAASTDFANPTLTVNHARFEGNGVGVHLTTDFSGANIRNAKFVKNGAGIIADPCAGECPVPVEDTIANDTFDHNSGDGLYWGFGTVHLFNDRFTFNGGWGFFAENGATVVNGGKLYAHGNGSGDCFGVSCG